MKRSFTFSPLQRAGSLLLMIALLWLTVSTPFVYRFQQAQKAAKAAKAAEKAASDDQSGPLTNTNEEKAESGPSLPQEYLHESLQLEHPLLATTLLFHHYEQDDFIAFHPEFITPPPDAAPL